MNNQAKCAARCGEVECKSSQYRKVAEANKEYFGTHAHQYDKAETCVVSHRLQAMLQRNTHNSRGNVDGS